MSDAMMFNIARMPYEIAMSDEMSRRQFYANTQRLAAALEAAREDAERYRWLRDREIPEWLDLWHQNPDRIDAAIDAAMQRTSGGGHG